MVTTDFGIKFRDKRNDKKSKPVNKKGLVFILNNFIVSFHLVEVLSDIRKSILPNI